MFSCPATTVLLLDVVPASNIQQSNHQITKKQIIMSINEEQSYFLSMVTWGHSGDLTAGCKAVEWWVITVQHHRINRVSLLKFKQELLHGLDGVVTTQIYHYLLNLETYRNTICHNMYQRSKEKLNILIFCWHFCWAENNKVFFLETVRLFGCPYIR